MRRDITALGVFAAATTLVACDNGTTSSPSLPDDVTTDTMATLTIWTDNTCFTQIEALAEDFITSTGVKVSVVQKSEPDVDTELTTQIPTGNGPDLTVMAYDKLGALVTNGVISPVGLGEAKSNFADVAVKAITYNGQTYDIPYAVESMTLVRNDALTEDEPKTYDDMVTSGKTAGVEYPFIIQMDDKGGPYHFYDFQTSFGAPIFNTSADDEYTSGLTVGGPGDTGFATWLKVQANTNVFSPSVTADIAKQASLDGKAVYTVTDPWDVAVFRGAGTDVSVLSIPSASSQVAQPFAGIRMFYQSVKPTNLVAARQLFNYLAISRAQEKTQKPGGHASAMSSVTVKSDDQGIKGSAKVAESGAPVPTVPAMDSVWGFWGQTEANIASDIETPAGDWMTMAININNAIASR